MLQIVEASAVSAVYREINDSVEFCFETFGIRLLFYTNASHNDLKTADMR